MDKEPEDEDFSFEDYEETEDEELDLPDIDSILDEEEEEEEEERAEPEPVSVEEKKEVETEEKPAPEQKAAPAPEARITAAPAPEEISRDEINLPLTIEIGRLNVSMETLLQLQQGNVLELPVNPESGVDLVINGKCIGKGELLKVGDNIAVRILQLS